MDTAVLSVRHHAPAVAPVLTPAPVLRHVAADHVPADHFQHPGDTLFPRLMTVTSDVCREFMVDVPAGVNLFTHLQEVLSAAGAESGIIAFTGGVFDTIDYHTVTYFPPEPAAGKAAKVYGSSIRAAGPITLLAATLSFGLTADGAPLLHCHAAFVDSDGVTHGGHLSNQNCIVAAEGVQACVSVFGDIRFRARMDSETTFSVFHPEAVGVAA